MYLKKLEMIGFKSFCNKTILNFEPGITAVVGPNGCGKSNIFDSIRWVLGEQSVKALRGSEMQDVIFNGTDFREPLGMAEVNLFFDNSRRFFNIDQEEMVITRRIFRSGESEYLLNKNIVRLKDILDLLAGTGVGAESYSLIAQGKIDLILSARPEERRLVFDEAAGITKYKAQKREATRKLEEAEQNFLRVNDIITEVKRQIGSLERQANKARRYKEVFEELKNNEADLAVLEKGALIKEKDEVIRQLTELETEEARLLEVIRGQEAKISNRQEELRALEANIMSVKNEILNLENLVTRNQEHISFNEERVKELEETRIYLESQIGQLNNKLLMDEEKLSHLQEEYNGIRNNIEAKKIALAEKENEFQILTKAIKDSLENIADSKKEILELAAKIAGAKNETHDLMSREQVHLARKKRLELERAKVNEEKSGIDISLGNITRQMQGLSSSVEDLNSRISDIKGDLGQEEDALGGINARMENLEKQKLTLESHRQFIEKLKTKYEDISESMNAVVYLDKLPAERVTGLVVKINGFEEGGLKLSGEAKPMDLDTQKIIERLQGIQEERASLEENKKNKEARIEEFNQLMMNLQQQLRNHDIALANAKTNYQAILEQFNKIKEEEEVIGLELSDVEKEIAALEQKLGQARTAQSDLENMQGQVEQIIASEQNSVASNSELKEKVLVAVAQLKTELDGLAKRVYSEDATLKILGETYQRDKESLLNIENQIRETGNKKESLALGIRDSETKITELSRLIESQKLLLRQREDEHLEWINCATDLMANIESDRGHLDALKNKLHDLQMRNKDIDFKFLSIKERILQNYKLDIETLLEPRPGLDENALKQEIQRLKEKIDSYGSVNLVAIEEYDELKKRYDFLVQQQNDLAFAKESLHEAILKINRTTRKMFLETFELVRQEFRNYFRLLFNGGDAQVFLIDEQDVLESGIEIICRPPGKKLQNVLLLSGGEKALSAIALIFAVFKVKPSPFCILDEIDAALDEANVDRYSRTLQEFAKNSQFIVITHNKRTIINADIMYGITMEESGISKIVSVKFSQDRPAPKEEAIGVA